MEIGDGKLTCDYCGEKSGDSSSGWCKINEVGITVCPNCQLGHWEELKKAFLNDNLNIEYIE